MLSIFLFSIVGCGDKEQSTSDTTENQTDTNTDSATPNDCTPLSEEECSTNANCFSITGQQMMVNSDGEFCIDPNAAFVFLECTAFVSDLTVEVYATPPNIDGECWYLNGATMPTGWMECSGSIVECQ